MKNKFKSKKIFTILTLLVVFSGFLFPDPVAAANAWNIRQEINITDGYFVAPANTVATSSAIIQYDPAKYSGTKTVYFEIVASTSVSFTNTVTLTRSDTGVVDCTVTIPVSTTAYTLIRSSACSMPTTATEYVARISSSASGTTGVKSARLVVLQSFADTASNAATSTQTQIDIGNQETYSNTATTTFASPKYWTYDSTKWDGTTTFYAEVTYKTLQAVASSTSYNTAGTFTVAVPIGTASTSVQVWGAGGAGGPAVANPSGGDGGAGGQYASSTVNNLAGLSKTLVVAAITAGCTSGTCATGADSTWDTTVVVAKGGAGGAQVSASTTGSTTGCVGDTCFAGGSGGKGTTTYGSGGGEGASPSGAGNSSTGVGVAGMGTPGGDGGAKNTTSKTDGNAGSAPGGGGGGGYRAGNGGTVTGGAGGAGQALVVNYIATTTIAIQEDDGSFGSWTDKAYILTGGGYSTSTRLRSSTFSPTTGRHYRIAFSSGDSRAVHAIYSAKIIIDQTGSNFTKLEPQYLLANTSLAAGTGLQLNLTKWDSSEWTGTTATYLHAVGSANGSASVVTLNTSGGTLLTGSTVTSPSNQGVSSSVTMPANGNLDMKATTNNNDVYASRILVQATQAIAGVTISGTLYGTDEATAITTTPNVNLSVNGGTATTVSANGSGVFSFAGVTAPSAGDIITIWISGATEKGALVFRYGSSCTGYTDCTGLSIYRDEVIVDSKDASALTNTNLSGCDNDTGTGCNTTDIGFTSNSGTLTLASGRTLRLKDSTSIFTPGGAVTADTFKQSNGTFNGGSGAIAFGNQSDPSLGLIITGGTFNSTTGNLKVYGSWTHTGSGTFNHNNGTVTADYNCCNVPGQLYWDVNSSETFYNFTLTTDYAAAVLNIGSGDTLIVLNTFNYDKGAVKTGTVEVRGNMIIGASADEGTATISFLVAGDQTITGNGIGGVAANLNIAKSSGTVSASGNFTIVDFTLSGGTFTSTSGTMKVFGNWTHTAGGTFNHNSGTIISSYSCCSAPTFVWDVNSSETFNNFTVTTDYASHHLDLSGDTYNILGTFTHTYTDINNGTINTQGNVLISSTAPGGNASTTFTGASTQTITNNGGTTLSGVYTINKTNNSDTVTLASNFTFGGALIVTKGVFSQGATYNATTTGTLTVSANGTWSNTGTGDLALGGDVANAGTITLNSNAGTQCVDGTDSIGIVSTVNATQRTWSGAGTFNLYNVAVQDMLGAKTAYTSTYSNSNWSNGACGISISGTVYTDEGVTAMGAGRTVSVKVNGAGTYTTTTAANGTYTVSNVTVASAGDVLTVFLDGATEDAVTVTKANDTTTAITGLNLYQNRVIVRHENGVATTNANLDQYDNGNDADIPFTVTSSNLTVAAGTKLIVWTGKTFTPGGTVTTTASSVAANPDGDLTIQASATLTMGTNALSIGGDFIETGTLSVSSGQTTTFTATGSGFTVECIGTWRTLTFDGVGGSWNYSCAGGSNIQSGLNVTNGTFNLGTTTTLTLQSAAPLVIGAGGTLNLGSTSLVLQSYGTGSSRPFINNGTFNSGTGRITYSGDGDTTVETTNVSYYDLYFSPNISSNRAMSTNGALVVTRNMDFAGWFNTLTLTLAGSATITGSVTISSVGGGTGSIDTSGSNYAFSAGSLSISSGGSFTANGSTITVTGSGTPFTNSGTFTPGTSTFVYTGTSATNITATTYNNLSFLPTGAVTYTLGTAGSQTISVNNLTIGNGTNAVAVNHATWDPALNISGNFTIASGAGTFTKSDLPATITFSPIGSKVWADATNQDIGVVVIGSGSATPLLIYNGNVKSTSVTINSSHRFGPLSVPDVLTLTGSGNPLVINGALDYSVNATYTGTSATNIAPTTYNNLTINAGSGTPTFTQTGNVTVSGVLNITTGTLSQGASYNLTSGAVTVGASGIWSNTGTGDVVLSGAVSNAGTITLNSNAGTQCVDGTNDIVITSSSGGTQRAWSGAGTFNIYNVNYTDMTGAGVTAYTSTASNSTWTTGVCTVTISGTVYTDEGSTTMGAGRTVSIKVNGAGSYTTTTAANGTYTISGITVGSAGDVLTVFLDGATEDAVTVSRANDTYTAITNFDLYQNFVVVRDEYSSAISNTNLDQYDSGNDADINFTVTTGALTVLNSNTLYVKSGTFTPGGDVTAPTFKQVGGTFNGGSGTITINGNYTLTGGTFNSTSGTLTIYEGNWTHTIGGTFTHNNGTVSLSMACNSGNNTFDVATSETFYNLSTTGCNNRFAVASGDTLIVTNTLNVNHSGPIDTGTIEVRGNMVVGSNAATSVSKGTGTISFLVAGDQTITSSIGNSFASLSINKPSGTVSVTGNLGINGFTLAGGTFTSTSGTLQVVAGSWTHTAGGTFNHNNGTVEFSPGCNSASHSIDVSTSETFYNLSTVGCNNTYVIGSGDTLIALNTLTINSSGQITGALEAQGNVVVGSNAGVSLGSGTATLTLTGSAAQTLTNSGGTAPSGIFTINKTNNSDTVTLASNWTFAGALTVTKGIFSQGATYNSTTTGALIVSTNGTWSNTGIGDMALGSTVSNAGVITLNSNAGSQCVDGANDIGIVSTVNTTQRAWSGAGTFNIYNVNYTDMTGAGVTAYTSTASNSTWTTGVCTVTISGTVYTDEGTTAMGAGRTVSVKVNGAGTYTTTTAANGTYTISGITVGSAGYSLTAFLDGATEDAVTISRAADTYTAITGFDLYQNFVVVRDEYSSAITTAEFDLYDSGQDADINFTATGGALTVLNSNTLYVKSGTFTPGGSITASAFKQVGGTFNGGSGALTFYFLIQSAGTFNSTSGILTLGQNLTADYTVLDLTGGTFNHNSGTVVFSGGTTFTFPNLAINLNTTLSLNNVIFETLSNNAQNYDINSGDILVVLGTLTHTYGVIRSGTIELRGNMVVGAGAPTSYATTTLLVAGDQTITSSGGSTTKLDINKPSGTVSVTGDLAVQRFSLEGGTFTSTTGTLTVGANESSNVNTFSITGGTFNHNSGTVVFTGGQTFVAPNISVDVNSSLTLNNVTFSAHTNNNTPYSIASGDNIIVLGTLTQNYGAINGSGTLEARGNVVIASTAPGGSVQVSFTGASAQTLTNSGGSAPSGMVTINKTNASDTVTLASNYTFANGLVLTKGVFSQGASYNFTTASTTYIGANGTWSNVGTGDVILGGNVTNAGIITLNSSNAGQCSDVTNDIAITSSSGGVQRTWSGAGTFNLYNVSVTDMIGAKSAYYSTYSNSNWTDASGSCGPSYGAGGGGIDGGDGGGTLVTGGGSGGGGASAGGGSGGGGGVLPQTFTAANGTALTTYDSNWTVLQGVLQINTNAVIDTGGATALAKWTAGSFNNNQFAEITLSALTANRYMGVAVRTQADASGYGAITDSTYNSYIIRMDSGGETLLYSGSPFTTGDIIRLEISGTTLTLKRNGTVVTTITDSTYSSGRPGIMSESGNFASRGDNWNAGSFASSSGGGSAAP